MPGPFTQIGQSFISSMLRRSRLGFRPTLLRASLTGRESLPTNPFQAGSTVIKYMLMWHFHASPRAGLSTIIRIRSLDLIIIQFIIFHLQPD
jgi:hypothetical protein